ncbi:MAG: RNA polymerase sigma-70 factor [Bacteroidota bacterium]
MFKRKERHIDELDFRTVEGFEKVYNQYWRLIYRLCQQYTDDAENAKELVQEIFESLWKNRHKVNIDRSLENYLVKAAKLKAFQFIRNKVSRREKMQEEAFHLEKASNDTEHLVNLNALTEQVAAIVSRLPEQAKKVYLMSREQGLNNKEIATQLSISPKTVENHLTKSLNYLRQNLL